MIMVIVQEADWIMDKVCWKTTWTQMLKVILRYSGGVTTKKASLKTNDRLTIYQNIYLYYYYLMYFKNNKIYDIIFIFSIYYKCHTMSISTLISQYDLTKPQVGYLECLRGMDWLSDDLSCEYLSKQLPCHRS